MYLDKRTMDRLDAGERVYLGEFGLEWLERVTLGACRACRGRYRRTHGGWGSLCVECGEPWDDEAEVETCLDYCGLDIDHAGACAPRMPVEPAPTYWVVLVSWGGCEHTPTVHLSEEDAEEAFMREVATLEKQGVKLDVEGGQWAGDGGDWEVRILRA
jgi:hypothetical protein